MIPRQTSCTDIFESGLLPVEQALQRILDTVNVTEDFEQIPITKARGRTLHEDVYAPFAVPGHDNSAVDGYAFHSADIPAQGTAELKIAGTAFAGKPFRETISPKQCIRIMTGAALPANADTVVMQEHVQISENTITIDSMLRHGQNIRRAGEDLQSGSIVLPAGKFLLPADIGLFASMGIAEIKVRRKLHIAIASSGDEVYAIGDQRSADGIYDSNRYSLMAALSRPDIEISDLGILEDKPAQLLQTFTETAQYADLIISSGGVSVGEADYTKTALETSGHIDFWKIAVKPGRPMAFGKLGKSVFFGLPGNPVAVMVTFYLFVLPAIEKMLGMVNKPLLPQLQMKSSEDIRKKPGRTEIVRGIIEQDSNGTWSAKTTGQQGSGILRSMSLANAFIILEHERSSVKTGEWVTVQPFAGLM
jgi:molybdopterin molybdotransferase